MNIIIKGVHMEMTDAIKSYVHKKLEPVNKFVDENSKIEVDLGKTTNHHRNGDIFRAEYNVTVDGKLTRIEACAEDLYTAIDVGQTDLLNTLATQKDKKMTLWRKGSQRIKEFAHGLAKRKRK